MRELKVLVAGDSFTYGSELVDRDNVYWKHLWPDAKCIANPGASNSEITRKLALANLREYELVVVMWSFTNRFEFKFNVPTGHPGDGWLTVGKLKEPPEIQKFTDKFFELAGTNKDFQNYTTWKEITFAKMLLEQAGTKFIFLHADWFSSYNVENGDHWAHITHDGKGFVQWADDRKFAVGPQSHPLDEAHIEYAKELRNVLDTNNNSKN